MGRTIYHAPWGAQSAIREARDRKWSRGLPIPHAQMKEAREPYGGKSARSSTGKQSLRNQDTHARPQQKEETQQLPCSRPLARKSRQVPTIGPNPTECTEGQGEADT